MARELAGERDGKDDNEQQRHEQEKNNGCGCCWVPLHPRPRNERHNAQSKRLGCASFGNSFFGCEFTRGLKCCLFANLLASDPGSFACCALFSASLCLSFC